MISESHSAHAATIADHIETMVDAVIQGTIPSVRDLCKMFSISQHNALLALKILAQRDFISLKSRKRPRILKSPSATLTTANSRSKTELLFTSLKNDIRKGAFVTNSPLPKLSYFAHKLHMSENTVRSVYRRLINENVAYRKGKTVLVGKSPGEFLSRISVRSIPAILVVAHGGSRWRSLYESEWTREFAEVFGREAQRLGVRLLLATDEDGPTDASVSAKGLQQARSLIKRLDHTYRGCVLIDDPQRMPSLPEWSHYLIRQNAPVVWFDRNDIGRSQLAPNVVRCHYSHEFLAQCAVEYLVENGHRSALYIHAPDAVWQCSRYETICSIAKKRNMSVRSHCLYGTASFQNPLDSGVLERLELIYPQCRGAVKESFDFMIQNKRKLEKQFPTYYQSAWDRSPFSGFCAFSASSPTRTPGVDPALLRHGGKLWAMLSLWPYFEDPSITAIISPNDRLALSHHLRSIEDVGLRVPRDVSIVSFDNVFRNTFLPLTTVDPGFGTLGYQAFHSIMNDLPISFNGKCDIAATPNVIDRGSVGPAKERFRPA